ncbi:MAG TPA: plastocyanin/azurin family copper-binding protein [Longimicrobiaceae bacterium]
MNRAAAGGRLLAWVAAFLVLLPACSEPDPPADSEAPEGGILSDLRRPGDGSEIVLIRVLSGPTEYRFEPSRVDLPDSGTVRFVLAGATPETIVFDTVGLAPAARDFLVGQGLLHGPLLVRAGQTYDASFHDAPPGRYSFHSLLHRARGMSGVVEVDGSDATPANSPANP